MPRESPGHPPGLSYVGAARTAGASAVLPGGRGDERSDVDPSRDLDLGLGKHKDVPLDPVQVLDGPRELVAHALVTMLDHGTAKSLDQAGVGHDASLDHGLDVVPVVPVQAGQLGHAGVRRVQDEQIEVFSAGQGRQMSSSGSSRMPWPTNSR